MRLASINLDSVELEKMDGISEVYPLPMPVFAKKSSDDVVLVHSLTDRMSWLENASMTPALNISGKSKIPMELDVETFEKHFMPLGGDFQGTGIYGKKPSPVLSIKVEVPCSYKSGERNISIEPNNYVIKTKAGAIKHFSEQDFNRLFVPSLDKVKTMSVDINTPKLSPSNDLTI